MRARQSPVRTRGGGVGGELAQDAVAGGVAEAVVDLLEGVDVGEQEREALAGRRARPSGPRRTRAGSQAGQRVDAGHVVLVALGGDEAALEELDRAPGRRVGDGVGHERRSKQVAASAEVTSGDAYVATLDAAQRPRVVRPGRSRRRRASAARAPGPCTVRAARQPQRGDDQRLQEATATSVAADRTRSHGISRVMQARRSDRERGEAPEQRAVRLRRAGQRSGRPRPRRRRPARAARKPVP